eukprot:m.185167 g.185167  ORF g.185167 m.185167 type:complete len:1013 (+) comp39334_c0_seq80:52-3090(+)
MQFMQNSPLKDCSVLSRLYGEIVCLHDVLHCYFGESRCPSAIAVPEEREKMEIRNCRFFDDEEDSLALCNLLKTTIVAHSSGKLPQIRPIKQSGEVPSSILTVLQYVISTLLKQGKPFENVLTQGHAKNSFDFSAVGNQGFSVKFPNTVLTVLKRKVFRHLLSRIGPSCFTDLLLKFSLFLQLPNGCYAQLAGYPAYFLASVKRKRRLSEERTHQSDQKRPRLDWGREEDGSHTFFNRSKLFYCPSLTERLHPECSVAKLKGGRNGARKLVEDIFVRTVESDGEKSRRVSAKQQRLSKGLIRVLPLFGNLLKRQRRTDYRSLLAKHCPFSYALKEREKADVRELLSRFSTPFQVVSFVASALLKVIPKALWGSNHNWKVFLKNVSLLVRMKRFEKMSVIQLLHGMKSSDCDWLKLCCPGSKNHTPLAVSQHRNLLFRQWLCWLIDDFVFPLIKGFFYVTESGAYRNRLFYFRKVCWKKVDEVTFNKILGKRFEEILPGLAQNVISLKKSLGISYVRILPKMSGSRIVVNMGKEGVDGSKSINRKLENLASVLNFEKDQSRELLGRSVFGVDDVYNAFSVFASKWKGKGGGSGGSKSLFFIKADISGCFDSIDQDKLLEICGQIVSHEEYQVRRYSALMMADGKVRVQYKRSADVMVLAGFFYDFAEKLAEKGKYHNAVLNDQVHNYSLEERSSLLTLLQSHIKNNFLKIHGKCYRQTVGIPQGSILSTLLCNFYLGHIENTCLHLSDGLLLMRMVDDYLIIAQSKQDAVSLYEAIKQGLDQYNCSLNPYKTLANFECPQSGFTSESAVSSDFFPWCGYLFHTESLEVRVDYSRYEGIYLSDCLTVDSVSHPFTNMKRRLLQFMKRKSHPLLLDGRFNSHSGVCCNVYQVGYILAMKTVVYLRELPSSCRQRLTFRNFRAMLYEVSSHYCRTARTKFLKLTRSSVELNLTVSQAYQLILSAYFHLFRRKQSLFKKRFMRSFHCQYQKLTSNPDATQVETSWKEPFEELMSIKA